MAVNNIARQFDRKSDLSFISSLTSNNVFINNISCALIGSVYLDGSTAVGGSTTVFVNGIGVHRKNDLASDGDICMEGSANTFAG
jgi:hypothetical protein